MARWTLLLSAALLALLAGCAAAPPMPVHRFVPVNEQLEDWGEVAFADRSLRFASLKGELQLEYVGRMSESAGTELEGASVYRTHNAAKYFEANRDVPGFCEEPPRWVAVNSKTGAPAWSGEIWISLLTLEEWEAYEPGAMGHCIGGSYVRAE